MQQLDPEPPKIKDFSFHKDSIYRWLKTDVSGTDEILDTIKSGFAIFKSGRKCNLELLQEFMDPISAGPDMTAQNKAKFNALTAGLEVEVVQAKHPEQLPGLQNEFTDDDLKQKPTIKKIPPTQQTIPVPVPVEKPKSPVRMILDSNKASMKLGTTLEIETTIPNEDIYRVLKNSFPDNDVLGEIAEKILSEMDTETILAELKEMIKNNLGNRYIELMDK